MLHVILWVLLIAFFPAIIWAAMPLIRKPDLEQRRAAQKVVLKRLGLLLVFYIPVVAVNAATDGGKSGLQPRLPKGQAAFKDVIDRSRLEVEAARSDKWSGSGAVDVEGKIAARLCSAVPQPEVRDWIGTIKYIHPRVDAETVNVSIYIADRTEVSNNSYSDAYKIPRGSKIYASLKEMKEGDTVKFSGSFLPDSSQCYSHFGVVIGYPDFVFLFTSIERI